MAKCKKNNFFLDSALYIKLFFLPHIKRSIYYGIIDTDGTAILIHKTVSL